MVGRARPQDAGKRTAAPSTSDGDEVKGASLISIIPIYSVHVRRNNLRAAVAHTASQSQANCGWLMLYDANVIVAGRAAAVMEYNGRRSCVTSWRGSDWSYDSPPPPSPQFLSRFVRNRPRNG